MIKNLFLLMLVFYLYSFNAAFAAEEVVLHTYYPPPYAEYRDLYSNDDTSLATGTNFAVGIGRDLDTSPPGAGDKLTVTGGKIVIEEDSATLGPALMLRDKDPVAGTGSDHYWHFAMFGTDDPANGDDFTIGYMTAYGATANTAFYVTKTPALNNMHIGIGGKNAENDPLIGTAPLVVYTAGSGAFPGSPYLSNAGAWTNATSLKSDKEELKELDVSGYMDKLDNLRLYSFKLKPEIYGSAVETEENGKKLWRYPDKVINPGAKRHIGYCFDDFSTPQELMAKDDNGKIIGVDTEQNLNFLMAAVKELIEKTDELEAKCALLKKRQRG